MNTAVSCGIDFGTSNSSLAYSIDAGKPVLSLPEPGKPTIPSAIFFHEHENRPIFGSPAVAATVGGEHGRFMRSLKRVLGTSLMDGGTVVNGRRMKFEDILAAFIRHIKINAEREAGHEIENVIMGRPVHFRDNDPDGDRRAEAELRSVAEKVGFKHIGFQFEPIAAAFAHEAQLTDEVLAVVADIGGGTSDFSVIRIGGARARKADRVDDILADTGVRIGGNDFDRDLSLKEFMPEFGYGSVFGEQKLDVPMIYFHELAEWSKVNTAYTHKNIHSVKHILRDAHEPHKIERLIDVLENESGHRLLNDVERMKIGLTDADVFSVTPHYITGAPEFTVTRPAFDAAIGLSTDGITGSMRECLKLAGIAAGDIGLVILTGGSTEIPYVKHNILSLFPTARVSQENKLSSVGLGLAYDAVRRFF